MWPQQKAHPVQPHLHALQGHTAHAILQSGDSLTSGTKVPEIYDNNGQYNKPLPAPMWIISTIKKKHMKNKSGM